MWDVFISHASEDKEVIARPLAEALSAAGFKVWYDDLTLTLGDSLSRSINRGLAECRYGIVILSPDFLAKEWPQRELDGLTAREVSAGKVILPVWHNLDRADIERYSPILADRLAVSTDRGLEAVVDEIVQVLKGQAPPAPRSVKVKRRRWQAIAGVVGVLLAVLIGVQFLLFERVRQPQAARSELGRLSLAYTPQAFLDTAKNGDVHALGLYLTAGMDPDTRGERGYTALMLAIGAGHEQVAEALLAAEADVNAENDGGATALDWAVSYDDAPLLGRMLESGARREAINRAFLTAASSGRPGMMQALIDAGAEAGRLASEALLAAADAIVVGANDDTQSVVIEAILPLGADPNVQNDNGWAPLHLAAYRGFAKVTRTLLQGGAEVNAVCECRGNYQGGWTALLLAAHWKHPDVMRILLDQGANVDARENRGRTALMLAAENGDVDMVQMLLDAGARLDVTDQEGRTALALARQWRRPELEQLLRPSL